MHSFAEITIVVNFEHLIFVILLGMELVLSGAAVKLGGGCPDDACFGTIDAGGEAERSCWFLA